MASRSLVGTAEAAHLFGVRPSNFVRDWASRPDFPKPVASLSRGRVWDQADLVRYRARKGRLRGARTSSIPLTGLSAASLSTVKRRLVERFHPQRIVVFGSQARGDALPGSDLDLLVVFPAVTHRHATTVAILRALSDLPFDVDVIVASEAEAERRSAIPGLPISEALGEGQSIYVRS